MRGRVPLLCRAHSGTPISSQIGSISGTGMKHNGGGNSFSHFSEEAKLAQNTLPQTSSGRNSEAKGEVGINESMQDTPRRVESPLTHGGK